MPQAQVKLFINRAIQRLKDKSQYADIRFHEFDRTENLSTMKGDLQNHQTSEKRGYGIRVLYNGAWGFASSEDCSEKGLQSTCDQALLQAQAASEFIQEPVQLVPKKVIKADYCSPINTNPFQINLKEKWERLKEVDRQLKDQRFDLWGVQAVFYHREIHYADTEGSQIQKELLEVDSSMYARATDRDGFQQRRSFQMPLPHQGSVGWDNLISKELFGAAPRIKEELHQLLAAPLCPEKKCSLILKPEMMALQTHETIGHALELDRILGYELSYAGGSHIDLEDFGHLQFGSNKLTARADGTVPNSPGSTGYDDDGVQAKNVTLIRQGLLESAITSRQMVSEANRKAKREIFSESGGANRAESYNKPPIERMNNINIDYGADGPLNDIIQATEDGVIMETPRSWSIGPNRENFHFACEIAWNISGGKLQGVWRNPTYHGHSLPFWNNLDKVGNQSTWQLQQVFNCGKGQPNQIMRLAHGVPICRFKNVEIGHK